MNEKEIQKLITNAEVKYDPFKVAKIPGGNVFGNTQIQVIYETTTVTAGEAANLVLTFLRGPAKQRQLYSRHLYTTYLNSFEVMKSEYASPQEMLNEQADFDGRPRVSPPGSESEIWNLIGSYELSPTKEDGVKYLVLNAYCYWEIEHGVSLVFQDGKRLVKVDYGGMSSRSQNQPDHTGKRPIFHDGNGSRFSTY